jgi:DNA-binding response OmpR family regulator
MATDADINRPINFEKVSLLVVDQSVHGCKILAQIVRGFGIRDVRMCNTAEGARQALVNASFDLVIADPEVDAGEGFELLRWLRRQERNANRFVPVILVSGHWTSSIVRKSRDCGANFFIAKPLTPQTMLERILWVSRDKRSFVEVGDYLGPDRRVKAEGPPLGFEGRRSGDIEIVNVQGEPPTR